MVVDCFLFSTPDERRDDLQLHREIAGRGMQELTIRNEWYFANLRENVLANPDRFLDAVDPDKLSKDDRFCLTWNLENGQSELIGPDAFTTGYVYAFTDPPYGLRCDENEKLNHCNETMSRLFGQLDQFTIRKWSTNWSNYFDAGNEWWGAFLWTLISDDGRGWWVGASTSD